MKGKSERNKFLAPLAWLATQVPWERGGRGRGAACPACRGGSRCRRPPQSVPRGCARAARARARARRAPSAPLPSGRGPARSAAQLRVSAGGVRGGGWAAAVRGLPSANSRLHGRYRLPSRGHRCPEPPVGACAALRSCGWTRSPFGGGKSLCGVERSAAERCELGLS